MVPNNEGSTWITVMRGGIAPPGWKTASRMKGSPREPRDPTGSIEEVTMGAFCEGQPERSAEPRSGVGPAHSTVEALKGNERVEGRNRPGGSPSEKAGVRTQSRVALPLKLWRVYEAAQRDKRPGLRHCCIMSMLYALERAFRR